MQRALRAFLALALAACAAAASADPPGRVARLNYTSGPVSFAPAEAPEDWIRAALNRPLTGGDRLWADRDGRAELHVGSTAVRLAPLTNVDILHLDDERLQLRVGQGDINLRVRDLDANDMVEIATPAGAVLVRQPGSYRIAVDPHGDATRVRVNFGHAEVVTPDHTYTVPSGQAALFPAGAQPAFEVAAYAPSDDFDRWSAERDRREDRVISTRYVSPHMTGYEDLDHYGTWRTVPEYGAVWVPASVSPGWAPYRDGHWVWVSPWGWTWVDHAPWGFAPFHYGRWVWLHDHWAWAPGRVVRRPIYAPALVAFVGGPRWSLTVASGPAIGWFPLGWREPYRPWYRASERHVHRVNVTHVTNVTHITHVHRHVHRRPEAVTVVRRDDFVSARPVSRTRVRVARAELERAEVIRERSPAQPVRASFAPQRRGERPPAAAVAREVVAVTPPAPQRAREDRAARRERRESARAEHTQPRVRVIEREAAAAQRGSVQPQAATAEAPRARRSPAQAETFAPAPAAQPQRSPVPPQAAAPAEAQRERAQRDRDRFEARRERIEGRRESRPAEHARRDVEVRPRAEARHEPRPPVQVGGHAAAPSPEPRRGPSPREVVRLPDPAHPEPRRMTTPGEVEPQREPRAARPGAPLPRSERRHERQAGEPQHVHAPQPQSQRAHAPQPQQARAPEPQPQRARAAEPQPQQARAPQPQPQQARAPQPQPQQARAPKPQPQQARAPKPQPQQARAPQSQPQQARPGRNENRPQHRAQRPEGK